MVLIFGLGSYPTGSGTAAALWFANTDEKVVITDTKFPRQLHQPTLRRLRKYHNVELILGRHRASDIRKARLIVRNPGVPDTSKFIQLAHSLDIPITNDVGVFISELRKYYSEAEVPILGVTGTRGKSTTTTLISEIMKAYFGKRKVHVGGNLGTSPLHFLPAIRAGHVIVLELSSWLLRDVHRASFHVAVVTNILRDHMNVYPNMKLYREDKERIFQGQTHDDIAVLNADDPVVRKMARLTKAEVVWFQRRQIPGMKLRGEHNHANVAAAYAVAQHMGVPTRTITQAIKKFPGVPNRLELIRTYKGREFYNDTTATTPDATIAALRTFRKKVILIAGGNSKKLPLKDLAKEITTNVEHLILLPGNANKDFPQGIEVSTMKQAVHSAWSLSRAGDIILLSPGVTWLPVMNEFERGKQFVRVVQALR